MGPVNILCKYDRVSKNSPFGLTSLQLLDGVRHFDAGLAGRVTPNSSTGCCSGRGATAFRNRFRRLGLDIDFRMPQCMHSYVRGEAAELAEVAFDFQRLKQKWKVLEWWL